MDRELRITCPGCETILIVDRITGEIIETRKPILEKSTGDRFKDAFLKADEDKKKLVSKFDDMKAQLDKKKKFAEDLFNESLKQAKEDKDMKPRNIFDND